MLREELSEVWIKSVAAGDVLLATSTDRGRDGVPRTEWILLESDRISVWKPNSGVPEFVLALADAESFRVHTGVGGGRLQARVDSAWRDVALFSNALSDRFAKLSNKLEEYRKDCTWEIRPEDEKNERRCTKCNLTLQNAGDVCPRCVPKQAVFKRVLALMYPHRGQALLLCGLVMLGLAIELAPPMLQKYLVDNVLHLERTPDKMAGLLAALLVLVALLAVFRLGGAIIAWLKGTIAVRVGASLTMALRGKLVGKLHELSVGYYDKHQVGVLVNRVAYDTEAMHSVIAHLTSGFVMQILQLVGVGVMLFLLNPKLALFMLIPTPFVIGGSIFFWRYIYPLYYRYWDSSSKQAGALTGMLGGIRVVKAFGQEQREFERFEHSSSRLFETRVGVESSTALFSAVMQVVFALGGLIVWYVGGMDVLAGGMTLGELMAFLAYLAMFYTPLSNLAQLTAWLGGFATAAQRVFELLDTPAQVTDASDPKKMPTVDGRIEFENVSFGYDRHRPVVRDLNFTIEAGESIGIVGRSGSGKTTVVNLVSRFYDATSGRVTIDGVDVREIATGDLRKNVGVVLQEPFLFRGTIWKNLIYGQPDATPDEVLTAARSASAHDFIIKLPLAYESPIGERGAGLSGGERQRLSIARAILYDPRILILDEATSSVDTESEKSIQDALRRFARGRTTIAIAHRLSTLRHANRIFVFDAGKLVEVGSHKALMQQGGIYANLVRIQTQLGGDDSLERLLAAEKSSVAVAEAEPMPMDLPEPEEPVENLPPAEDFWLDPCNCELSADEFGCLKAATIDGETHRGVFAVPAFPATRPDEYISLRTADADGKEHEVGILRNLAEWPTEAQALVRSAVARRSLVREIQRVHRIREHQNYLDFDVTVSGSRSTFTMRWSQNYAIDYGENGKLLHDVDDNLFVVRNVDALPKADRMTFKRIIYW